MSSAAPKRPDDIESLLSDLAALRPMHDPLQEWMLAHRDELAGLTGQRAAIDPARGILASGPTLADVHAALGAAGLMDDEAIVIVTVQ